MVVSAAKKKPKSRAHMTAEDLAHESALALVEEQFHDFSLVWAKVDSYPWWPAIVFHSWDVVRAVGLPTEEKKLPIPVPRHVPVLDVDGTETGDFRVVTYCLVMFVDQFNFSVVEVGPKSMASYVGYYNKYYAAVIDAKPGSKIGKYKKRFKDALEKADGLLHMGPLDDPSLLEMPKIEKPVKKRRTDYDSMDDALDDRETDGNESEAASYNGDEAYGSPSGTRNRRGKKTSDSESSEASSRKKSHDRKTAKQSVRAGGSLKGKGIVKRPTKVTNGAASKRKDKGPKNDPIDLTDTPESVRKQGKKSAKAKPKRGKQPAVDERVQETSSSSRGKSKPRGKKKIDAEMEVDDLTDLADDDDAGYLTDQDQNTGSVVMTPLSSIWTTKVDAAEIDTWMSPRLAYKQDFVWDTSVFTDGAIRRMETSTGDGSSESSKPANAEANANGRERTLNKRQPRSVQQAQIRQNLMFGNLDPHTMVQCESYRLSIKEEGTRSRGPSSLPPPFTVVVHPDATFVSDLHAHLATCEIIGFLGGKWDEATKTLYIQAAFPCRSLMIDGDDGSTDVEMDPGSEIELRGIISDAELEVVGWYHSHPAFAPDPSIRDIENQASYQQLFKRAQTQSGSADVSEPFVGLIVGTYDTRRDTPVSLFRYFHVRGEKVSGGARREICMPYEFIPVRRYYRSVLNDEANEKIRGLPVYPSVLKALGMTHRFRSAISVLATTARDENGDAEASLAVKASPPRKKPSTSVRKRKQSVEIGAVEAPTKRGKRVRKKRGVDISDGSVQIDLTMDDSEEIKPCNEVEEPVAVTTVGVSGNDSEGATTSDIKMSDTTKLSPEEVGVDKTASTRSGYVVIAVADATKVKNVNEETVSAQPKSDGHDHIGSVSTSGHGAKADTGEKPSSGTKSAPSGVLSTDVKQQIASSTETTGFPAGIAPQTSATVTMETKSREKTDSVSSASWPRSASSSSSAPKGSSQIESSSAGTVTKSLPRPTVITEIPSAERNHLIPGVSPSSATPSGRRRNRKPAHTNKNRWPSERSPHSDRSRTVSNSTPVMNNIGYFQVFHSMDLNFQRNRSDPSLQVKETIDKSKEEPVTLRRPLKDPEYFFIGDADTEAPANDKKSTDADTLVTNLTSSSEAGATTFTPGHCSTDDEIELIAVDEDNEPSTETVSSSVDHSSAGGSKMQCIEEMSKVPHQLQSDAPPPATVTTKSEDSTDIVRECLRELVDEVMSEIVVLSRKQVVKSADIATCGLPEAPSTCDPIAEPNVMNSLRPASTVEVRNTVDGYAAGDGDAANSKGVTDALAGEAAAVSVDAPVESETEVQIVQNSGVAVDGSSEDNGSDACDGKSVAVVKPEPESALSKQEDIAAVEVTAVKTELNEAVSKGRGVPAVPKIEKPLLFGRECQHEDIRTSLEKMERIMKRMQPMGELEAQPALVSVSSAPHDVKTNEPKIGAIDPAVVVKEDPEVTAEERKDAHLASLRTRYGAGMFGCVEQVVTLVDYYRDFERRINLSEPWKGKISKLRKIEASLSEYVQYLNLSVDLRRAFVEDLIGYLELSWELTRLGQ